MAYRFFQRIDSASTWTTKNPILGLGEIGFEVQVDGSSPKEKVGDGVHPWTSLPYSKPIGTAAGTYAAGDDSRIVGSMQRSLNLADVLDVPTARNNLGLGTVATHAVGEFDAAGVASAAVSAHAAASDPHNDRAYAMGLVDDLSGVSNQAAARNALGLGSAAVTASGAYDVAGAATTAVSAHAGATDPHGDRVYSDGRLASLGGVTNAAAARTALGLGTAAVTASGAYEAAGAVAAGISTHSGAVDPHGDRAYALTQANAAVSTAAAAAIPRSVITTDGDLVTRASGAPARITRAQLAADQAFQIMYGSMRLATAYGALGDGSTDDATAINACIAASKPGDIIFFPATGASSGGNTVYLIGAQIILKPTRTYMMSLCRPGTPGVYIKMKNAANLPGMLVSEAYQNNATSCGEPFNLVRMCVNGNKANNTVGVGIIGMNYNAVYDGCYVSNTAGDGLVLTDTNVGGTTIDSAVSTMSNVIIRDTNTFQTGGHGCLIKDTGGSGVIVDGTMTNCYFEYAGLYGLYHQRMAGWFVDTIHSTASMKNGVHMMNLREAFVHDVQVDGFGLINDGTTCIGFNLDGLMVGRYVTIDNIHVAAGEATHPLTNYIYGRVANQTTGLTTKIGFTNFKVTQDTTGGASSVGLSLQALSGGTLTFIDDPTNDFRGLSTNIGGLVYRHDTSNRIDRYIETMDRDAHGVSGSSTSPSPSAGTVALTYFHADQTMPVGTIFSASMDLAQAGATLCKMGLYLVNPSTGDVTCIARTASDLTLWATINTGYSKVIADDGQGHAITSVMIQQGWYYATAILHVGSTTAPRLAGHIGAASLMAGAGPASRRMGYILGQTDLPASATGTTINGTSSGSTYYQRLTP